MKKTFLFLILLLIVFSSQSENPWVKKLSRKPLHSDSTAMFNIRISQQNKFDKEATIYQALVYYSGKNFTGSKEVYYDFPGFGFSYYRLGDSAFLFDKISKQYYSSQLKQDSVLYVFDLLMQIEVAAPIFMPILYQPGFMSSTAKDVVTSETHCIGWSFKGMPGGPLMSMGYEVKMTEVFAKPCTYIAVMDTLSRCFRSLYLNMDTSKVMGDNPISIHYNFDKIGLTSNTHDSIRQMIVLLRKSFSLSTFKDNPGFEEYKNNDRHTIKPMLQALPADESQKYILPLLTTNGDTIHLNDFKGRYILLDFWFVNCPPCMRGVPKINAIFEKFKNKNLVVIGINPFDKMDAIKDVAQKREMKYTICQSPKGFDKLFKVPYFPTYLLVAPDQKSFQTIKLNEETDLDGFMKLLEKKLK